MKMESLSSNAYCHMNYPYVNHPVKGRKKEVKKGKKGDSNKETHGLERCG